MYKKWVFVSVKMCFYKIKMKCCHLWVLFFLFFLNWTIYVTDSRYSEVEDFIIFVKERDSKRSMNPGIDLECYVNIMLSVRNAWPTSTGTRREGIEFLFQWITAYPKLIANWSHIARYSIFCTYHAGDPAWR